MVSPIRKVRSATLKRAMSNKGMSRKTILKRLGNTKTAHIYERKDGALRIGGRKYALYSKSLDKKRKSMEYSKHHPIGSGRYRHTRDGARKTGAESIVSSFINPLDSLISQKRRRK
jgi:hypothetical protein